MRALGMPAAGIPVAVVKEMLQQLGSYGTALASSPTASGELDLEVAMGALDEDGVGCASLVDHTKISVLDRIDS